MLASGGRTSGGLKLYKGSVIGRFPEFSEGFDFVGYLKNSSDELSCPATLRYLAAADPEATAQLVRESLEASGKVNWSVVGAAALEGRASMTSEEEAAGWIAELLQGVDEESRLPFISNLITRETSEGRSEALIKHLPGDQDRLDLARHLMKRLEPDGRGLTALRVRDSEALRVRAIEYRLQAYDAAKLAEPGLRSEVSGKLEALMENLEMSDPGRKQVREMLPAAH